MDGAVSLVRTYLHLNGYFTVTEFPLVEYLDDDHPRTATDIDVLACRFPAASTPVLGIGDPEVGPQAPDPALGVPDGVVDMIVGEVKEANAEFNRAGLRADVLAAALVRFGCCAPGRSAEQAAATLLAEGIATTPGGHRVRMVAFGTRTSGAKSYRQVSLAKVLRFLEDHVRGHWHLLRHVQIKDPTLAFLALREKVRRG